MEGPRVRHLRRLRRRDPAQSLWEEMPAKHDEYLILSIYYTEL